MSLSKNCIESGDSSRILRYIPSLNHEGEPFYFVVAVRPGCLRDFMKLQHIEHGQIMQYGEIISSGKGKIPEKGKLANLKSYHDATYEFIEDDTLMKNMDESQLKMFMMDFCAPGI